MSRETNVMIVLKAMGKEFLCTYFIIYVHKRIGRENNETKRVGKKKKTTKKMAQCHCKVTNSVLR